MIDSSHPLAGRIYNNSYHMDDSAYQDNSYTIAAVFKQRVILTPDKTAYIQYDHDQQKWINYSWTEMQSLAAAIQAWLQSLDINAGDRIALMIPNGTLWVALDQAAAGLGIITVPLYPNDREDNVQYILERTSCRLLIIDSQEQYAFSKDFTKEITSLSYLASTSTIEGADITNFTEQLESFPKQDFISDTAKAEDPATIVFTSGTTGRPKGVVLTHRNVLSNAAAASRGVKVTLEDRLLSFLPLSHTFERTVGYYAPLIHGAEIVYTRSIEQLAEDLQNMQPTILISVPRIYERVFAKIEDQVEKKSAFAQKLFHLAHKTGYKKFCYQQGTGAWSPVFLLHPLLDTLVAKKIRSKLGGRLKYAVAGGAAFSKDLNAFFIGMGINVLQGYGMTESSPVISTNRVEMNVIGSVGKVLDNVEVSFSDVGELLVRGESIMQGYWQNPDATKEVLNPKGWLRTGDIARLENEILFITGRVKEIIVLSNGEKIAPADIEHAICTDPIFDQTIVIGERRPFLSAIVVLNTEACKNHKIPVDDLEDKSIKSILVKRIAKRMNDFPGYAQIYQITATTDPWEVENGLLTPTLKIRRAKIREVFKSEIDAMYEGH